MTRASRVVVAAALLVLLAGCVAGAPRPGTSEHTVSVGEGQRTYRLYLPAAPASADGFPLVVMLHGGLGSATQAERSYGWDDLAAARHFAVVYPDGLGRTWNAGSCCGAAARDGVDDVGFVAAVVADVGRMVPVDPARVYATGMSNGAMMAYRLACETTLFAAVAPVAGDQMVECARRQPTSLLHVHGSADTSVPLDGSPGSGVGAVDGPPVEQVVDAWRRADGCGSFAGSDNGPVSTRTATCPEGRTVELVLVSGAGHQWPGSAASTYPGADPPSEAFSATELIWTFFTAHAKG